MQPCSVMPLRFGVTISETARRLDDNGEYDEMGNGEDPTLGMLSVDVEPDNYDGMAIAWVDIVVRLADKEIIDVDVVYY